MEKEQLFDNLHRWGKNALLLDTYVLLLPTEKWQADTEQSARLSNQLGEIYFDLGRQQQAMHCFEEALNFYRVAGIWEGEAKALNNLGTAYRRSGQIALALASYREAEQLWQNRPEHVEKGVTLNNLGRAFQHLGQIEQKQKYRKKHYQQALSYYQQAIAVYKALNDDMEMARTLNNLGEIYEQLQRFDQSYTCYRQALQRFRALDEKRGEGIVCNNLGVFYYKQNRRHQRQEYHLSLEYYLQALHIFREIGDRWQEAATLRNIGRFYVLERRELALACFLLAKDIYEAVQQPERGIIPREICRLLAGKQSLDALIAELHPRAFQIVEDGLKNEPPGLTER